VSTGYILPSRSNLHFKFLTFWHLSARVPKYQKWKTLVRPGWHWTVWNV